MRYKGTRSAVVANVRSSAAVLLFGVLLFGLVAAGATSVRATWGDSFIHGDPSDRGLTLWAFCFPASVSSIRL